jgi:hypothetical protein
VQGLENFRQMMNLRTTEKNAIKVYVEVADDSQVSQQPERQMAMAVN